MSMNKRLFRPGKGNVIESYTAAVASEAMYPNDWVRLDSEAPATAGVNDDGVFEGETLGVNDYIHCLLTLAGTASCEGYMLGVVMGSGLSEVADYSDVSGHPVAAGDVVIIQNGGVHPGARTDGSVTKDGYLIVGATAGEADGAATGGALNWDNIGMALTIDADYTRVTTDDEQQCITWVRL